MELEIRPEGAKYKIIKPVGEGQSARVFKAIREDSHGYAQQVVALKVLKSKTAVSRMRDEFHALSQIRSPHCVRVLAWENLSSLGDQPGGSALALEWIDGVTLYEYALKTQLSEAVIFELIRQVQLGLKDLRDQGLSHGDLSPKNILIDRDGLVRLVDFGSSHSIRGTLHATPGYIAPEVWAGAASSYEADLFSLGLIRNDLQFGFPSFELSQADARKRALDLSSRGCGLLSLDPNQRKPLQIDLSLPVQKKIARDVKRLLRPCGDGIAETAVLEIEESQFWIPRVFPWKRGLQLLIFLISATATPVQAEAPLLEHHDKLGSLMIRTHYWIEVEINGRRVGYTPISPIKLRSGSHRMKWRSAHQSGEFRFQLRPGQKLRISDRDLVRFSNSRNY